MNSVLIFVSKFYKHAIFFIIITILIFSSYLYFDFLKIGEIKKDGNNYIKYIIESSKSESQNYDSSVLELIQNKPSNFGLIAKLNIINTLILDQKNNDYESKLKEAKIKLVEIFKNKSNDKIIRDFSLLIYLKLFIKEKNYSGFEKELIEYKKEIDENYVFKAGFDELNLISLISQNKNQEAKDLINLMKKNYLDSSDIIYFIKQFELYLNYK